jgi:hypothetical protein
VVVVFFFFSQIKSVAARPGQANRRVGHLSRPPDESIAIPCVCVCVHVFGSNRRDFVQLGGTLEGDGATCHGEVR